MEHFILSKPISELDVSEEFKQMAVANQFPTLKKMLTTPLHDFHTLHKSGYRMRRELSNLLDAQGIGHLVNQ